MKITTTSQITLLLMLLGLVHYATAQTSPTPPQLEYVCSLKVSIADALVVGETPHGTRRIIPITGGTFEGPNLKGTIINGGADWQVVRKDGVAELSALYTLKTEDGTLIYVKNTGMRVATPEVAQRIAKGEKVSPTEYYFRAIPVFETPPGKYEWLTKSIFVSTGVRNPDHVLITVYRVL